MSDTPYSVNSTGNANVSFRLPDDHARELARLADKRGQSKGKLAKQIVTAALIDYDRIDELSHRLTIIERSLEHIIDRIETITRLQGTTDELKASLATATTRLLVEGGRVELEDAVAWTQEAFGVKTCRNPQPSE